MAASRTRPINTIRDLLRARDYGSIQIWKLVPEASATESVAQANAERDRVSPNYGARCGPQEQLISPFEYERLAQAGAEEIVRPTPGARFSRPTKKTQAAKSKVPKPRPKAWAFDLGKTTIPAEMHVQFRSYATVEDGWRQSPHGPAMLWLASVVAKRGNEALLAGREAAKVLSDRYFDLFRKAGHLDDAALAYSIVLTEVSSAYGPSPHLVGAAAHLISWRKNPATLHEVIAECRLLVARTIRKRVPKWPG